MTYALQRQDDMDLGFQQGLEQGIERGEEKAKIEMACEILHMMTDAEIANITKLPLQRIAQLREQH